MNTGKKRALSPDGAALSVKEEQIDAELEADKEPDAVVDQVTYDLPTNLYCTVLAQVMQCVLNPEAEVDERKLFSEEEIGWFDHFLLNLDAQSKFLFAKLYLRKPGKWHTSNAIAESYKKQLTSDDVTSAVATLTAEPSPMADLLERQTDMPITELLAILSLKDLKDLAKLSQIQQKNFHSKTSLIAALGKAAASHKSIKSFFDKPVASTSASTLETAQVLPVTASCKRISQLAISKIGSALRIKDHIREAFDRLLIVYFRSTIYESSPLTSALLAAFKKRTYPTIIPVRSPVFDTRDDLIRYQSLLKLENSMDTLFDAGDWKNARSKGEEALPQWLELLEHSVMADLKDKWKIRFTPGWILTRVVYKLSAVYGKLHQYSEEIGVLRNLLSQTLWRNARRGAWYTRLALVIGTHMKDGQKAVPLQRKAEALEICLEALQDEKTTFIYRPALAKRIARLEKALKKPSEDCLNDQGIFLKKPFINVITGFRCWNAEQGPQLVQSKLKLADPIFRRGFTKWQGKTDIVSVEEFALESYAKTGYKGYHAESRVMKMIFTLLFWDIIFSPQPGAFETIYQNAPLDLREDCFYETREPLIEARLKEISNGMACAILTEIDNRERKNETFAIGIQWDYSQQDLIEIITCMESKSLVVICRTLSQEYGQRTGGMPDLTLWNFEAKTFKFAEVKSDKDVLSETQMVWIDLLLAAGVDIEVCKVKCSNPDDASASNPRKLRESSASELSANVIELSDSKPLMLKEELKVQPFKSAKNIAKVITILSSDDSDIEVFSSKKKDHLKS